MGTLCQAIEVGIIDYADARVLQSALAAELAVVQQTMRIYFTLMIN